jgi:hypothetical protein
LTIFADYFQVILMDERSADDFSLIWTAEAFERMLAVGESAVCIGTLRNVDVPVEVEVVASAPSVDYEKWNHVAEGAIDLPSGSLVVMSCTGYLPESPKIAIAPGQYELLFLAAGIETIEDEAGAADDIYRVYLWPGMARPARLLKHWRSAGAP